MKKILLSLTAVMGFALAGNAQCTLTNATSCRCSDTMVTNCDLLPDITIARLPLTQAGNYTEYSQVCNPPCSGNDGRLRLGVSTPIIGFGPLETRGTSKYVCGTDTIDAGTVANIPATCPVTGLPPHQLINQRIYHKTGNVMSYTDRAAGSMTYHPTHGHQHVDGWGIYTLRSSTADPNPLNWPIIGSGTKLGFCLLDIGSCNGSVGYCTDSSGATITSANFNTTEFRNYGLGGGSYGCSNTVQGISNGYMDTYSQSLDGMWIVIPPGICNGTYYVVVQIDPYNYFTETNENNNVLAIPFTLTKQAGSPVTVTPGGPTSFCQGGSVTLTATGGALDYLWSNGATTQSIVVNSTGNYSVSCNTTTSCPTSSSPVAVTVSPMTVTASSTPASVCQGQSIQLSTVTNASATASSVTTTTSNTQVFIPDNNAAGVTSPITISGITPPTLGTNSIVSVTLNLNHTYDGDLIVSLISPSGNTINLSNRRGGSGDNFTNTVFTMNSPISIASGTAPFSGSYAPDGAFSSLTGNANGTWQLKVADVAAVDTGRILNWSLAINNTVTNVVTYSWSSLPAGFSSSISNPVTTPSGTTDYTVSTSDLNGCAGSSTVTVVVNPNPVINVSPAVSICQGASTTLTASGGSTYLWSTGETTASISVSPAATTTYTVTGTTAGCSGTNSVTVTVNSSLIVSVSPPVAICAGTSTTLTASGATSYVWSPGGATSSSITVSPSGTTTYTVTGTTAGCSGTNSVQVTVNSLPVLSSSSTAVSCFNGSNGTATVSASVGMPPYTYSWNTLPVQNAATATGLAAGSYIATVSDANGCSASQSQTVIQPIQLSSSGTVTNASCGFANGSIDLTPSGGTSPYSFSWNPGGASSEDLSGIAAGSYSVLVTDANACTATQSFNVISTGGAPSAPSGVTGNTYICRSSTGIIYSTPLVNGATSYTWTVPAGAAIASGQGTNTLTVDFSSTQSSGNICVSAGNSCGSSASFCKSLTVVTTKPAIPASISGPLIVCGGATGLVYSCPLVANAQSYSWTFPNGVVITSGSGTNSVTVNFPSTFTQGTVRVSASNCVGNSNNRSLSITGQPTTPGLITGQVNEVCAGSTGIPYSIAPVNFATGYTWTPPTNSTIASGQGTTSITINYNASFTTGTLRVVSTNSCGSSSARATAIHSVPNPPAGITGASSVCANQAGVVYSIVAVPGATSYSWTVPSGAVVASGQGSTSITVNFGSSSGKISVRSVNSCGQSSARSTNIAMNCRESSVINGLEIFPNPAHDKVTISFSAKKESNYNSTLSDVTGRKVLFADHHALAGQNTIELNLADFAKGVYFLVIEMQDEKIVQKIAIE